MAQGWVDRVIPVGPSGANRTVTFAYPSAIQGQNQPPLGGPFPTIFMGHGQIGDGSFLSGAQSGTGFAGSTYVARSLVTLGYMVVGAWMNDLFSGPNGSITTGGANVVTNVINYLQGLSLPDALAGKMDITKLGYSGTSQGGMVGYALMTTQSYGDARILAYYVRATNQTGSSGALRSGPALIHAHGTADATVSFSSGQTAYNNHGQPRAFVTLTGKGHDLLETGPYYMNDTGTPSASGAAGFFGYFLLGDATGLTTIDTAMTASGSDVTIATDWGAPPPPPTPPVITSFTPNFGAVGTAVQITGTDFTGTTAVRFNGTNATFTEFSSTRVDTVVPSGATDGVLTVVTAGGSDDSPLSFDVTTPSGGGLWAPHNPDIAGVWALLEFATGSTLTVGSANYNQIVQALNFEGVIGFCARVHVDQLSPTNGSFVSTLLDQCMACVNSVPNKKFAVRLIGGRYTPDYVFDTLGARSYSASGGNGRAPYACGTDKNTPNQPYVTWLSTLAGNVKTWMLAQGAGKCPLLHWTWYSNQYSEFYHGPELQSDSTATQFVNASNALIDAAYALSDSNIACSFGMSGTHVEDVQVGVINHMTSIAGDFSPRLYYTANGLDDTGDWGATTEATQDSNTSMAVGGVYNPVAGRRVSHGEQDINPGNWTAAYRTGQVDQLIMNQSDFWEIYTTGGSAFNGSNAAAMQTQITRFVAALGEPTPPPVSSQKVLVID